MASSSAAGPRLIGPPAVRVAAIQPAPALVSRPPDDFMDLMDASFNAPPHESMFPPMGFTENLSATYLASGNPCLDFFFQVVPKTPSDRVTQLLTAAWKQDSTTALKLIAHLRGVRGTGKSDRAGFYTSALWLHQHHPKTLALNAGIFAEFGYMKDLLEILYRIVDGADTRQRAKSESRRLMPLGCRGRVIYGPGRARKVRGSKKRDKKKLSREERIAAEVARVKIAKDNAASIRHQKHAELAKRAVERYARDPDYRFLHDCISEFFAGMLTSDFEQLNAGRLNQIGLAAKWCPSLDSSFDRTTLLCESIARRMFPRESHEEYKDIEEAHYAYRVRDRLRKEVLVPLRKVLQLPEVYMSARHWDTLPYGRVASVAMKRYKVLFMKHDKERFEQYLEKVKEGKAKIAAGGLYPHEILEPARHGEDDEVAELQWRRMVSDMLEKGKLKNCIAVCDVSGSMDGPPMDVCVALGLLLSELSEEPWKGRVITFSATPQIHKIMGERLSEKINFIERMEWGMNTDFQRVFDQILHVAVEGKLAPEKMIKRIFVFSDMEFDEASSSSSWDMEFDEASSSWDTDYQVICKKFQDNGYGNYVPEIVFWNLRDSSSTPVTASQKGVALVSGFSKNIMKVFLDRDGAIDPVVIMEDAISGLEYQKLVVFD